MEPERCFIDTNLFLRYLTDDIPHQAEAVERLLRRAAQGEIVLVTNSIVMAEIVWVLETVYHLPRRSIAERVLAILNTPGLEVVDGEIILQAVVWYAELNIDFADAYNGAWMLSNDIESVYTFDRHLSRLPGVTSIAP